MVLETGDRHLLSDLEERLRRAQVVNGDCVDGGGDLWEVLQRCLHLIRDQSEILVRRHIEVYCYTAWSDLYKCPSRQRSLRSITLNLSNIDYLRTTVVKRCTLA